MPLGGGAARFSPTFDELEVSHQSTVAAGRVRNGRVGNQKILLDSFHFLHRIACICILLSLCALVTYITR